VHTIIIRTDGSRHIGIGHVMRCLAFAECLEQYDIKPIFAIQECEKSIQEMITKKGYMYILLPRKCSFDSEFLLISKLINKYNPIFILTDLCNNNTLRNIKDYLKYLNHLKNTNNFLVVIEDIFISTRFHPADVLINMNYGAENMGYQMYSNLDVKLLLGPTYFIFRDEFIEIANLKRTIKKKVKNILVTMGGNDLLNLTLKIVKSLLNINTSDLFFKIVIGPAYSSGKKKKLISILKEADMNYEILLQPNNMAKLMFWSDLAITACGLTKYETAVTGTPNISIAQHSYEHQLMRSYSKTGSTCYLGYGKNIQEKDIIFTFRSLISDWKKRREMCKRGKLVVNPNGKFKIMEAIKEALGNRL